MWSTTPDGLTRPSPLRIDEAASVGHASDHTSAIASLMSGTSVVVTDRFSTGLDVLAGLKRAVGATHGKTSYRKSRVQRAAYHDAAQHLLVPIRGHSIALEKAPAIGWLKRLYPDVDSFHLPLPQVQGLNGSWQWYEKGIAFPVLGRRFHPFYGTYFPTRFEHLELFDQWLSAYRGLLRNAIDVGTGCGVLTFQLLHQGAAEVWATDTNANAIASVREELDRTGERPRVRLSRGDLFASFDEPADLIVFNPPWLPKERPSSNPIDDAIYYPEGLFERFFEAAATRLRPDGRLVIVFSSLRAQTHPDSPHPVQSELARGRFVEVGRMQRAVGAASSRTKRQKKTREEEHVELWELAIAGG